MYFQSQTFLYLFLPVVLVAYLLVPAARMTLRNSVLFAVSLVFYAWGEKEFVAVLLGSLVVNFALAHGIERSRRPRLVLTLAVLGNLALLFWLKYAGFFATMLGYSLAPVHLPIGVSFFTFQAISYVVDVYRREVPAERSVLRYGLYVFLFPHLIAGPIVRYADLAESLANRSRSLEQFAEGIRRFTMGLAKKILLADTLAVVADQVFRIPPHELATSAAWLGLLCYSLQIYFDFSGYSDMAIGLGKMFGFEFAENFRYPYAAYSVTDFWRRWHISLSSWFRDYVYIPLGGNRGGPIVTCRNLLIVFVLCGLWHGANWTFLVWGIWHGVFLILERWMPPIPAPRLIRHLITLLVVSLGWVFFRSQTLEQAEGMLAALFARTDGPYLAGDVITNSALVALLFGMGLCAPVAPWLNRQKQQSRYGLVFALAGVALFAGWMLLAAAGIAGGTYSAFIYFRF